MTDRIHVHRASWREWDDLIDRMPDRTVFHRTGWLRSLESSYGLRSIILKVKEGERLAAVWPWLWLRKGPLRIIGSPLPGWSTPYLGPLFAPEASAGEIVRAILKSGELGVWAFASCRILDGRLPVRLESEGFRGRRPFETCYVDLRKSEDELWSGLKGSCRSRIRKARKSGLEFSVETDGTFVPEFWEMAREVFARSRRQPSYSESMLRAAVRELSPRNELLAVSVHRKGERLATLVLPHDGRTAMYWAGGARGDSLPLAPNNLLHWEAILECRRRGLERYDFISTKGGPGRFKKTFGPEVAEVCTHWEASASPLVAGLRRIYERRARRARRIEAP